MESKYIAVNAVLFSEYAEKLESVWAELNGVRISHEMYGDGVIVNVHLSNSDFPRIEIKFHAYESKIWSPSSFKSGKTTFFLPPHISEPVEQWRLQRQTEEQEKMAEKARLDALSTEQKKAEILRIKSEEHRINLERLGIVSKGIRRSARHYEPHCWKPHNMNLDSAIHFECINCNWLICPCGACGCGRKLHFMAND